MSKVFRMLKGDAYWGEESRVKGAEEGVCSFKWRSPGGHVGLVEDVTFKQCCDVRERITWM